MSGRLLKKHKRMTSLCLFNQLNLCWWCT